MTSKIAFFVHLPEPDSYLISVGFCVRSPVGGQSWTASTAMAAEGRLNDSDSHDYNGLDSSQQSPSFSEGVRKGFAIGLLTLIILGIVM